MKKQLIKIEFAEFLKTFVPEDQLQEIIELTEFTEIEVLTDYVVYCHEADELMNLKSWSNYYEETLNFF